MTIAERAAAQEARIRIRNACVQIERFAGRYAQTIREIQFAVDPSLSVGMKVSVDKVCRYRPDFVLSLEASALAGGLLHECAHVLENHHGRALEMLDEVADWFTWQVAADLHANALVLAASDRFSLPDGVLLPEAFDLPSSWSASGCFLALRRGGFDSSWMQRIRHTESAHAWVTLS